EATIGCDTAGVICTHGFYPQIEPGKLRYMGQVDARIKCRTAGRGQRRRVVIGDGVVIDREPVPQVWDAVMEVESAAAITGIILREVCTRARVTSHVEEAPGKGVRGKRLKAFAGEGDGARKAQFQVLGWLKADLLTVNKRPRRETVSGKAAKEGIVTQSAEQRKIKRYRARYAQHVERLGI